MTNNAPFGLKFSTDTVPKRCRLGHWREAFGKAIAKMDWLPLTEDEFHQEAIVQRVAEPGIVEATRTTTGNHARGTPQLIATGSDDLVSQIQITGAFELSRLERRTQCSSGVEPRATSISLGTI